MKELPAARRPLLLEGGYPPETVDRWITLAVEEASSIDKHHFSKVSLPSTQASDNLILIPGQLIFVVWAIKETDRV